MGSFEAHAPALPSNLTLACKGNLVPIPLLTPPAENAHDLCTWAVFSAHSIPTTPPPKPS
eukprot:1158254-Pelagomonas_calceolata.AAC.3